MIRRYTYERLTDFVGNTAMPAALSKGFGVVCAAGGVKAGTQVAASVTKNAEISTFINNRLKVGNEIGDTKKREKVLMTINETVTRMAERPAEGLFTKALRAETTEKVVEEGGKTVKGVLGWKK